MRIEDITAGKKYTQIKASDDRVAGHGSRRERKTSIVRVLEVKGGQVLASLNGSPATWMNGRNTRYWKPFIQENK